jgi:hypothetical protein
MPPKRKDPAAVALGRKGGRAWARTLSKKQLRERMSRLARIRWAKVFRERARAASAAVSGLSESGSVPAGKKRI